MKKFVYGFAIGITFVGIVYGFATGSHRHTFNHESSEPALKQSLNLKNLKNFPNQRGKSGTKPLYVVAADDDIADTNETDVFRLATCNLKLKTTVSVI